MQDVKGSLLVENVLDVRRRMNQGLSKETITGARIVTLNDYAWLQIINASTQDVILPDATTLAAGWNIVVAADTASNASVNVKSYAAVTPLLIKNILSGRAYRLTLLDGATAAGVWQITLLGESDSLPAERFIDSFNATSDWGSPAGGYYSRTVAAATHDMGTSPTVKVRAGSSTYTDVMPDSLSVSASGDITIQVPQLPDLRFEGQMIIS